MHVDVNERIVECVHRDRLVGLVVKASASRAENPGFESRHGGTCVQGEITTPGL